MRIGVTGGLWFHEVNAAEWGDLARRVEALGFESLWIGDHLALPSALPEGYPYTDDGHVPFPADTPLHDPLVVLAAMATATTRIRLGTAVYLLPLRAPVATPASGGIPALLGHCNAPEVQCSQQVLGSLRWRATPRSVSHRSE